MLNEDLGGGQVALADAANSVRGGLVLCPQFGAKSFHLIVSHMALLCIMRDSSGSGLIVITGRSGIALMLLRSKFLRFGVPFVKLL